MMTGSVSLLAVHWGGEGRGGEGREGGRGEGEARGNGGGKVSTWVHVLTMLCVYTILSVTGSPLGNST